MRAQDLDELELAAPHAAATRGARAAGERRRGAQAAASGAAGAGLAGSGPADLFLLGTEPSDMDGAYANSACAGLVTPCRRGGAQQGATQGCWALVGSVA
jgi:hypothetical protein